MSRWACFRTAGHSLWFQARTQVLLWYLGLMIGFAVTTSVAVQQILAVRLQARIEKSLVQEIAEFRRLSYRQTEPEALNLAEPIPDVFDRFLAQNVPGDDEYFLTFWQGEFYKSSARALPTPLQPTSSFRRYWARLTQSGSGEFLTSVGPLLYRAEWVQGSQQESGVLVVAQFTAGEQQEIEEVVWVVSWVTLVVLCLVILLGWWLVGRVLTPLSTLSEATRTINATALTQRIPVQGRGEVAELAQRFNDMMSRLEAAFNNQRQFMNDLGHELRTPLTIVRGHLELIGDHPQERQETLALVLDELDRMSGLVNDLLLLARAERPDFLHPTAVDVAAFTEVLYQKARAIAPRRWCLESVAAGQVWCDRHRITEAVINLAQNATQHTQATDEIGLGSRMTATEFQIWVRDTGEGIAPALQSKIFERFSQAGNGRYRPEGLGLGLAIVQAIVRAHGGSIHLESQLGTGSTFTIVLPLG